jgi:hypothetical protein
MTLLAIDPSIISLIAIIGCKGEKKEKISWDKAGQQGINVRAVITLLAVCHTQGPCDIKPRDNHACQEE